MYLTHFGFHRYPFETTPDPHFFYQSPSHREAMAAILYGVEHDKGLMLISGDVGTGKTTLLRAVLAALPEHVVTIFIEYPFLSMEELLLYLAEKLEVEREKVGLSLALADALARKLVALSREGKKVLVVIDEAQHLDVQTLEYIRLLSNFQTPERKLLTIVLAGQTELLEKVNRPELRQLRQRIVIQRSLSPLSFEESVNYIRHRLLAAGSPHNPFTVAAMKLIFKRSGGIPRLINALCDNALVGAYATRKEIIFPRLVRTCVRETSSKRGRRRPAVLLSVLGIAVVGVLGWLFLRDRGVIETPSPTREASYYAGDLHEITIPRVTPRLDDVSFPVVFPSQLGEGEDVSVREDASGEGGEVQIEVVVTDPTTAEPVVETLSVSKTVSPGDVLVKILAGAYGKSNDTLLDVVGRYNPALKDINLLYSGQRLVLPSLKPESFIFRDTRGKYIIHYYSSFQKERTYEKVRSLQHVQRPLVVFPVVQMGKTAYRIYIGPFESLAEAKHLFLKLPRDHLPF